MKARMLAAFAACFISTAGFADQGPGTPENTYRNIAVAIVVPRPCVSVRASGARILLSANKLVELSGGRRTSYQNEEQRLALIAGNRAAALLATASHEQDASGCAVAELDHAGGLQDPVYLIAQLIESGDAVVIRDGSTKAETSVRVHDYNGAISGFERFEFADGTGFLFFQTWVA